MVKKKKRESIDVIGQFRELFWAARRAHVRAGRYASPDDAEYKCALSFARENGLEWGEALLEVSLFDRQNKNEETLKKLKALWDKIPDNVRCIGWYLRGCILRKLKQYDGSIKASLIALEDANFDSPGNAWISIGNAYLYKGENDKAIETYHKVLDDPNYDTPSYAWYNLGIVYSIKSDYKEAIKVYQKALDDPCLYRRAQLLTNLAEIYHTMGMQKKARATLEAALKEEDPRGQHHSRARSLLSLIDADMKPEAMSISDRALLERPTSAREEAGPEQRILSKMQAAEQSQYESYLQDEGSKRDNVLSILRGWSSAVTLMEGSERLWRGGGYFLKWQGKGIVIDPGFDFLRNFHDAGYHAREINAVLVSHNHSDHNADLKSIDDLRYELYKRRKNDPHGGIEAYVLVWDSDSQATVRFSVEEPEHQFRPILFDIGRCNPDDTVIKPHNLPFSVTYFPVRHGPDLHSAVGFKLILKAKQGKDFTLGFTSDTEFFAELPKYLEDCDVLLAHISQPDSTELVDTKKRKENHLGYRGLAELIRLSKPKLTLVGEFWAGLTDLRIDLVQGLRSLAGTDAILPTGIGMHLNLPEMEIECTECKTNTMFADVRVAPPAGHFGDMAYLCPNCILA